MNSCKKCDLSIFRKNIVWGKGNPNASIMIIGEAPGYYEDKYGVPFYPDASSGSVLSAMLYKFGFNREDHVYITNIIKCKTPNDRDPSRLEIFNCRGYLLNEVKNVKPKIIILLGRVALNSFFNNKVSIRRYRGKIIKVKDTYIIATYHPSYIARNKDSIYYTSLIKDYNDDFNKVYQLYKLFINPLHKNNIL